MGWTIDGSGNTVASANYTGSGYGFIHNTGLWEDLRFPAQAINPPGGDADPGRNSSTGLLEFDKGKTETIAGVAQMPHSWKSGTNIEPHAHIMADAATEPSTGKTNVVLRFSYAIMDVGGTWDQATYTNVESVHTINAFVNSAPVHQLADFGEIDMTGYKDSCCILWKVSRLGADGADTYDNDLILLEFDIHYRANTLGSLAEYGEDF